MTFGELNVLCIYLMIFFALWAFAASFKGMTKFHLMTKKYLVPVMALSFIFLVGIFLLVSKLAPMIK